MNSRTSGIGNKKSGSRRKTASGTTGKSTEAEKIVDIAVFADPKLYNVWEGRYPQNAKVKLKGFILSLLNNVGVVIYCTVLSEGLKDYLFLDEPPLPATIPGGEDGVSSRPPGDNDRDAKEPGPIRRGGDQVPEIILQIRRSQE